MVLPELTVEIRMSTFFPVTMGARLSRKISWPLESYSGVTTLMFLPLVQIEPSFWDRWRARKAPITSLPSRQTMVSIHFS